MDLLVDSLKLHSCEFCEKFILDPSRNGESDADFYGWRWKPLDPELTIGGLRELAEHDCLFVKRLFSEIFHDTPATWHDRIPIQYHFIRWRSRDSDTLYEAVTFGSPPSKHDGGYDRRSASRMALRLVKKLITASGTGPMDLDHSNSQD